MDYKTRTVKFKRIQVTSSMFFGHSGINKVSQRKVTGKSSKWFETGFQSMKEPLVYPRYQKYKPNFFKHTWAPGSLWILRLTPQNSTHILKFLLLQKAILGHLQNSAPPHLFHGLKAKDNWTKISCQVCSLLQFKLENTAQCTFLKTTL